MSLDSSATILAPLTLDGLASIELDILTLNGYGAGVVQCDANDTIYVSDTVTLDTIQARNNTINLDDNTIINGDIQANLGRFLTLSANTFEILSLSATNIEAINLTTTNIRGLNFSGLNASFTNINNLNISGVNSSFNNLQVLNLTGISANIDRFQANFGATFLSEVIVGSGNASSIFIGNRTTLGQTGLRLHTPLGTNAFSYIDVKNTGGLQFRVDNNLGASNRLLIDATGNLNIQGTGNLNLVGGNIINVANTNINNLNVSGNIKTLLTASRALVTDAVSNVIAGSATALELSYLSGASSNIQSQINGIAQSKWGLLTNNIYNTNLTGNVGIGNEFPDKRLTVSGNILVGNFKPWNNSDTTNNIYLTPLNNSQICSISLQTTANSQHLFYFEPSLHTLLVSGTYNVAINGDTRQQITSSSTFLNISGNRSLEIDTASNQCALDFHSRNSTFSDFDARIVSLGGNAGGNFTGGGQLFFLATTFAFNNQITVTGGINISGGNLDVSGNIDITGSILLFKQSADTVGQNIEFYKKRGATTPANDLDALGTISGYGLNSTGTAWSEACRIRMTQQNVATSNVAGRMIFNTRNQSGSLVEQITIDDRVIINKNSNNANLYLEGQTELGTNGLRLHYASNNAYIDLKGSGDLNFRANNTDGGTTRGKITSGGIFRWGSNNNFDILADSQLSVAQMSVSTTEPIVRRNAGNFILQISSSDQRIKKNIRPISDEYTYDAFRKIKPVIYDTHKYVDNGAKDVLGFIAQDLAEILPPSSIHKHKIINKCEACRDCGENCEHPEKCDCLHLDDCLAFNQDAITALNANGVRILMRDLDLLQRNLITERIQYKAEKDKLEKQVAKLRLEVDAITKALRLRGIPVS